MSNNKAQRKWSIVLVVLIFFICTAFAFSKVGTILKYYSDISEYEMVERLNKKDFKEILDEINDLGNTVEISDLIIHAEILKKKAEKVSEEEMLKEISNSNNSDNVRVILLQIKRLLGRDEQTDKLEELLKQDNVDFEIKRNVLLNIFKINKTPDYYEKIIRGSDDRLAFQALKLLSRIDVEKALEVSDDIIKNYDGSVQNLTGAMRGALKTKARYIGSHPEYEYKSEFVELCDKILKQDGEIDYHTEDTVIFALSDMHCKESITYIVKSDNIDYAAKLFSIDQNYEVLRDMLLDNPGKEDIEIVLEAMDISPLVHMADALTVSLDNVKDEMLEKRIIDMIEHVKINGSKGSRWEWE